MLDIQEHVGTVYILIETFFFQHGKYHFQRPSHNSNICNYLHQNPQKPRKFSPDYHFSRLNEHSTGSWSDHTRHRVHNIIHKIFFFLGIESVILV